MNGKYSVFSSNKNLTMVKFWKSDSESGKAVENGGVVTRNGVIDKIRCRLSLPMVKFLREPSKTANGEKTRRELLKNKLFKSAPFLNLKNLTMVKFLRER